MARRTRERTIAESDRDRVLAALSVDLEALFVIELTPAVVRRGVELLVDHPLRAADALQLASCLTLAQELRHPVSFAAFDQRLLAAARAEGLELAT